MAERARHNLITLVLVASLMAAAYYSAVALTLRTADIPREQLARMVNGPPRQLSGSLYMEVETNTGGTLYHQSELMSKSAGDENISIYLPSSSTTAPLISQTNSNGLVLIAHLPVSNRYTARIQDSRFHLTVPFSIVANMTTFVMVGAGEISSPILFAEVFDRGARTIFVRVSSAAEFTNLSRPVFLDETAPATRPYSANRSEAAATRIPVKIASTFESGGGTWVELRSSFEITPVARTQFAMVTYIPFYTEGWWSWKGGR